MKIGYSPTSSDFSHPVDRRKACFYFARKGIGFESAILGYPYDVVYLSSIQTDIEGWLSYIASIPTGRKRPKLIFDLTDSYLNASNNDLKTILRGTYRYCTGIASRYRPRFSKTLIEALSQADAVVCGSLESKSELARFNSNIHVIRDYFWDDIKQQKQHWDIQDGALNVFWEGLSHGNRKIFSMLGAILSEIRNTKITLHVVTAWNYCNYGGRYLCKPTGTLLNDIFKNTNVNVCYYTWNSATLSSILSACDIALIPIPKCDPIMTRKPENKLVGLWAARIPVITSATPSYQRVMNNAGLEWTCEEISDWENKITSLAASKVERQNYIDKADKYIERECSDVRLIEQWDVLFDSLR